MNKLFATQCLLMMSILSSCVDEAVSPKDTNTIDPLMVELVNKVNFEPNKIKKREIADEIVEKCRQDNGMHIHKRGIDAIATLLNNNDEDVKSSAVNTLGCIGAPARYTIPLLQKKLVEAKTIPPSGAGLNLFMSGYDWWDLIPPAIEKMKMPMNE